MRALVQRVANASVRVGEETTGEIGPGLCVFIGVTDTDDPAIAERLAAKLAKLRIFDDDAGVMNRSVTDVGGEVLVVSQFTLYADARKGNRPSYIQAAKPDVAEPLVSHAVTALSEAGLKVATGRFRADMAVSLVNDGPVTIWLEI